MNLEHLAFKRFPHFFFFVLCVHKNNSSTFAVILFILEIFCRSVFSLVSSFLLFLNHFHCSSSTFTCFFSLHLQSSLFPYFFFIRLCFCSSSLFFHVPSPIVFAYCVYIHLYIHPPQHCEQEQKL